MPRKKPDPGFTLDQHDRKILRLLQRTNKVPHRIIAEAINLSTAAVQRRIIAMEAAGVIRKNVALVDPDAVSVTITAIVEVQLNDELVRSYRTLIALDRVKTDTAIVIP